MKDKSAVILVFTIIGVVAGVVGGLLFGGHHLDDVTRASWTSDEHFKFWLTLVKFPGELFVRGLKLLVLPLVVASMICGVASLGNLRDMGRMGRRTMIYFITTTVFAALLGVALVTTIQPGAGVDPEAVRGTIGSASSESAIIKTVTTEQSKPVIDRILDVIRELVPSNLVEAALELKMLGLIAFSLIFGIALTMVGERGKPVLAFFDGVNEAVMKMVYLLMYCLPIAVASLIAANIAGSNNLLDQLVALSKYVLTVLAGLGIHLLLVLPAIYWIFLRRNPFQYLIGGAQALLTALSTSSSAATLPVTMECCVVNNGISRRTSSFVLPLGATINMDGTALYEAVAVIFLAQMLGHSLSGADIAIISLISIMASIGAAAIPSAGMVTMVMVLDAVGMDPMAGITYILAIDWFLDRFRTAVNVAGDTIGAAIVDDLEKRDASRKTAAPATA
ncbi:MAG: dicarboxylate/amino acid:cation symporter [Planctomycetaceae bacterium]|nr:dicarboxylate/amino acid:cation symporter [Planctomycetaceae bacterium]